MTSLPLSHVTLALPLSAEAMTHSLTAQLHLAPTEASKCVDTVFRAMHATKQEPAFLNFRNHNHVVHVSAMTNPTHLVLIRLLKPDPTAVSTHPCAETPSLGSSHTRSISLQSPLSEQSVHTAFDTLNPTSRCHHASYTKRVMTALNRRETPPLFLHIMQYGGIVIIACQETPVQSLCIFPLDNPHTISSTTLSVVLNDFDAEVSTALSNLPTPSGGGLVNRPSLSTGTTSGLSASSRPLRTTPFISLAANPPSGPTRKEKKRPPPLNFPPLTPVNSGN